MLPISRNGMQAVSVSVFVVLFAWVGCSSPESYRAGRAGLSTGSGGSSGGAGGLAGASAGASGAVGGDTGASGTGGALAGSGGGVAGDMGAAGSAGAGAAGASGGSGGADAMGAAGASAAGSTGTGTGGTGTAGAGAAGAAGGGATSTGTAGAGTAGAPAMAPPPGPLALPVIVSDYYRPTGGMGDAAVAGAVTVAGDATACTGAPTGASQGACYTITYHPQPFMAGANSTWAGFYWQYPDNNWGTMQPITIATGAKDVSFWAKGMAGGESITFEAGGIMNQVSAATPYTDGFAVTQTFQLTKAWTKYTLPMTGMTYAGGVLGAFAWVAKVSNTNAVTFYLDGIVWE
jgi:hypothetical protein